LAILAAMRLQTRTVLLASELGKHPLRSISLTHGADHLDARGRSPMCRQSSRPSLGGEAGGRPRVHLSFIFSAPLLHDEACVAIVFDGPGQREATIGHCLTCASAREGLRPLFLLHAGPFINSKGATRYGNPKRREQGCAWGPGHAPIRNKDALSRLTGARTRSRLHRDRRLTLQARLLA
jgi:hypothetical protein